MENEKKRFAGKGYYIALIACIAAVGISGYVFVKTARDSAVETSATVATVTAAAESSESPQPSAEAQTDTMEDTMEDAYEETLEAASEASTGITQWPLQGQVLMSFSRDTLTYSQTMADWRTHEGLDIAAELGAPVVAAGDGTVTAVYEDDYLGSVVVISHSGDLSTRYGNLMEETNLEVGDQVSAGDTIGTVGHTALLETSDPAHLHFEVFAEGNSVDPLGYLPEE
jgi:murein DD-endopeptidase MepM/ murein hydrolase activator NlpD